MKTFQELSLTICLLSALFVACKKDESSVAAPGPTIPPIESPAMLFNSGFERGVKISTTANAQRDNISGVDSSVQSPNDWVNNLQNKNGFGTFSFYYEQGDSTQRFARIVNDPLNAGNKVLSFAILKPHIVLLSGEVKGRVQAEQYNGSGVKEFYESVKLYLPTDFNKLSNGTVPGPGDWITLFEYWNNVSFSANPVFPFRVSLNIDKPNPVPGSPLCFEVHGQTYNTSNGKYTDIWKQVNTNFPVPIGKWMTIEIYFKEGVGTAGRYYFAVTPEGGTKTVVFDIINSTCHPNDTNPDGLTELSPLKFYTSGNVVNYMNSNGGKMQVYWDDYTIWKNKKPQ